MFVLGNLDMKLRDSLRLTSAFNVHNYIKSETFVTLCTKNYVTADLSISIDSSSVLDTENTNMILTINNVAFLWISKLRSNTTFTEFPSAMFWIATGLRKLGRFFQSESFTEWHLVLHLSGSSVFCFTRDHPVAAYVFFSVFSSLLSFLE